MNLEELVPAPNAEKVNKLTKRTFGYSLDLSKLSENKAQKLHKNLSDQIRIYETKLGSKAQTSKKYYEMKLALETLSKHLEERMVDEEDVEEANAFNTARDKAIADGKDSFSFNGKTYKITKKGADDEKRAKDRFGESKHTVKEYYVKTADDVMANLPAFAYRKSNPQMDTPEDKKYVAAIGDKADMVYSKLKKWLASGNNFNPNQIKMLDDVASKIEFLDPMDQTDEEVIDMLNSGLDTVMSIIEPKTERVEAVKERKHSMGRPKPAPQGNARPRMKPMGRPGMKSQMSNMPT